MNLKDLQIRKKFFLAFSLIFTLVISGGWITYSYITKINDYQAIKNEVANIIIELNKANKVERDFMLDGWKKPDFLKDASSKQTSLFNSHINRVIGRINQQLENDAVYGLTIEGQLVDLKNIVLIYQKKFNELKKQLHHRGFKDYGLEGDMREYVHRLQDTQSAEEKVFAFSLRRHEKDFGLRKDLKYVDRLNQTVEDYITFIRSASQESFPHLTDSYKENSIAIIKAYRKQFNRIVQADITIGLTENSGLRLEIEKILTSIEPKTAKLYAEINNLNKELQEKAVWVIGLTVLLLIVFSLFSIQFLRKTVSKPIRLLDQVVNEVLAGSTTAGNDLRFNKNRDEIGSLSRNFGHMLENLKNNLKVIEEKNIALEKKAKEDELKNWKSSGLAHFGDLIKNNTKNIKDFGFSFISNLVKYMAANQGVFFVLNEDEDVMEAKACYAFNRKKMLNRQLSRGESLAGQAWLEGDYIYLTDVPNQYINIRSGLGDAPPTAVIIVPVKANNRVVGIIELASFKEFSEIEIEFLLELGSKIGGSIDAVNLNQKTRNLLENSQELTEQLQAQEEEMRQNMEELEATQEEMQRNKHQLETSLQQISQKSTVYQSLIQKVYDAFILINTNFKIESINEYVANLLEYKEEEIYNQKVTYIFDENLFTELKTLHNDPNYIVKGSTSMNKGFVKRKHGHQIEIDYVISRVSLNNQKLYSVLFNKRTIKKEAKLIRL